jgi:hypothetical protein
VVDNSRWPKINMVSVKGFDIKNGILEVRGITYGPNDPQINPTRHIIQRFKYENGTGLTELK